MESSFEKNETSQAERRAWLVANLREKGYQDPEARETLIAWMQTEEEHAARINSSEANIEVIINKALLLKECGLIADAEEELGIAWDNAIQEGNDELREKLKIAIAGAIRNL